MTDKERYKQAFSVLHASGNDSLEVLMQQKKHRIYRSTRRVLIACICTAMLLGLGITAYAYSTGTLRQIFGWGENMKILIAEQQSGGQSGTTIVYTSSLTEPVVLQDGRMIFIVNGQHLDITSQVSQTSAFHYSYIDPEGNTHLWLVGLNSDDLSNYGYAEYIQDSSGAWVGGYSARVNIEPDGSTSAQWLNIAKSEANIPW